MKKLVLSLMMVAVLAFSCSKEEDPTLTLSKTSIDVPNTGATENVTVTTNQAEWIASSGADWIVLTQSATAFDLQIKANPNSGSRQADIVVIAGGASKKLTVVQAGSQLSFDFSPKALVAGVKAGEHIVKVNTNSANWTVTSAAEWIKAEKFGDEIKITVTDNPEKGDRTADITITDVESKSSQTYTITQGGAIIFPYIIPAGKSSDVKAFEEARGNSMVIDLNYIFDNSTHTYNTQSELFPKIMYGFSSSDALQNVTVFANSGDILTDPDFIAVLEAQGFTAEDEVTYTKDVEGANGGQFKATIDIIIDPQGSGYIVEFVPVQAEVIPTFDEMPYGLGKYENTPITKAKIDEYEAANKGTYIDANSDAATGFYWYDVTGDKYDYIHRLYFMQEDENENIIDDLSQTSNIFSNLSYCYYEVDGQYLFTNEWKELMAKEGFNTLLGSTSSGFKVYENDDQTLAMFIGIMAYQDVNGGEPILDIRFSPSELVKSSAKISKLNASFPQRVVKSNSISKIEF